MTRSPLWAQIELKFHASTFGSQISLTKAEQDATYQYILGWEKEKKKKRNMKGHFQLKIKRPTAICLGHWSVCTQFNQYLLMLQVHSLILCTSVSSISPTLYTYQSKVISINKTAVKMSSSSALLSPDDCTGYFGPEVLSYWALKK